MNFDHFALQHVEITQHFTDIVATSGLLCPHNVQKN